MDIRLYVFIISEHNVILANQKRHMRLVKWLLFLQVGCIHIKISYYDIYILYVCIYIYMYILLMISICVMCSEVTQEFRRGTSKLIQLLCLPNIRLQKQPIRFTLSWCGHTIICIHNLGIQCDFSKSKEAYTFNQMVAFYSSRLYTYQNIILWYANYLPYLK